MGKTAIIRAPVDPVLKEEVEDILQALGLSTTQAITLFYQQVRINQGLPFDARLPNALTQQTFADMPVFRLQLSRVWKSPDRAVRACCLRHSSRASYTQSSSIGRGSR